MFLNCVCCVLLVGMLLGLWFGCSMVLVSRFSLCLVVMNVLLFSGCFVMGQCLMVQCLYFLKCRCSCLVYFFCCCLMVFMVYFFCMVIRFFLILVRLNFQICFILMCGMMGSFDGLMKIFSIVGLGVVSSCCRFFCNFFGVCVVKFWLLQVWVKVVKLVLGNFEFLKVGMLVFFIFRCIRFYLWLLKMIIFIGSLCFMLVMNLFSSMVKLLLFMFMIIWCLWFSVWMLLVWLSEVLIVVLLNEVSRCCWLCWWIQLLYYSVIMLVLIMKCVLLLVRLFRVWVMFCGLIFL